MTTKTLTGPCGIRIELDDSLLNPDDPGEGTPALVYLGKRSGTYWCVVDTGEIEDVAVPRTALDWLDRQCDAVEDFLYIPPPF